MLVAFVFLSGLVSPEYCRILRWGGEQRRDFHIYGDGRADSGRIYDFLNARSPSRVFRDIASLEPGVPWRDLGREDFSVRLALCVVVIGNLWLTVTDDKGKPRLDDLTDTLRCEITAALHRKIFVIPVLVGWQRYL